MIQSILYLQFILKSIEILKISIRFPVFNTAAAFFLQ